MNNNDRLLRLRYAIDLKDTDLIKAFELGGVPLTKEEAQAVLTKVQDKNKDNAENNVILLESKIFIEKIIFEFKHKEMKVH
ncbi:hypothetical protein EfmAA242_03340 [Enterococcus faecium]|nr:hypothetical protein EfmAA242_03340 [Enterococcus faecium]